jgi:uncharacterized delta-60 repeat protein
MVPFRRAFVLVCFAATVLGATGPANATPGALDPAFGSGGLVTTDVGGNLNSAADGVAVQPDGRIVVGGSTQLASGRWCFFVARYLTDGSLDPSFGNGGITITDLGSDAYAGAMTLTADGHILVAGSWNSMMTVAEYRADGSLETSFGSSGVAQVVFPGPASGASAVHALPDGTILITGSANLGDPSYRESLAMARLTASGLLDTSFGRSGLLTTSMPGTSLVSLGSTVTPKGKIVLVGWSWPTGGSTSTMIAQYLARGSVDRSFNRGTPKVVDLAPGQDDSSTSVTITSGGAILALSGVSTPSSGTEVGLVSLQPNGSFTTRFGSGGTVVSDPTIHSDQPRAVFLQSDGKILVAGSNQEPGVVRFTSSGALDPTFGSGGVAVAYVPSGFGQFNGLAARPDGSVIAAGVTSGETLLAAFQTT